MTVLPATDVPYSSAAQSLLWQVHTGLCWALAMSWGFDGFIRTQGGSSPTLAKALICSEHLSVTDQISPSSKLPKPKESHFKLIFILFPFRLPTTHWLQQTHPSFPLCSPHLTPPWLSPHASFTYYSAHLPIIHHQIKTRKWMHQCIPPWNDLYKKVMKAGCDGASPHKGGRIVSRISARTTSRIPSKTKK